jgi:1-deoxy-D-xylulose-5-phosphate reductoisomerase
MVHPQSVIHSLVEFHDGSTLAQCSPPDMRLPIALALGWPDRVPGAQPAMDWTSAHELTFEPLDEAAFPAVALARRAGRAGGTAPGVLNAANEEAVEAFRTGRITFPEIVATVSAVVDEHLGEMSRTGLGNSTTLADVLNAESWSRERARTLAGLTVAGVS